MNYLAIIITCFVFTARTWADVPIPECSNSEEAKAALDNIITKVSNASSTELFAAIEAIGGQCADLLVQNEEFQLEISVRISALEKRMSRNDYHDFDLSGFTRLYGLAGIPFPESMRDGLAARVQVAEAACSAVDRRAELPPVRDQGSVGWCYAYAAADLVSHRSGETVSAVDLALNYNLHQNVDNFLSGVGEAMNIDWANRNVSFDQEIVRRYLALNEGVTEREGGWSEEAINILSSRGFCLESTLPSDSYESGEIGRILMGLNHLNEGITIAKNAPSSPTADYLVGEFCTSYGDFLRELNISIGVDELVSAVGSNSVVDLFYQRSMDACRENRIGLEGARAVQVRSHEAQEGGLVGLIDQQLDRGGIAGLNYNVDLIGAAAGEFSLHASSVVGRRWSEDPQSCQYLIRNSWGEGCFSYGAMNDRCENGHIWVDAADVEDRSTGVFYFE